MSLCVQYYSRRFSYCAAAIFFFPNVRRLAFLYEVHTNNNSLEFYLSLTKCWNNWKCDLMMSYSMKSKRITKVIPIQFWGDERKVCFKFHDNLGVFKTFNSKPEILTRVTLETWIFVQNSDISEIVKTLIYWWHWK